MWRTRSCQSMPLERNGALWIKSSRERGTTSWEVKDNQPALMGAVEDAFLFNKSSDYASQMECGHGRIETRECKILPADAVEDEEIRTRWNGLKTIVEITSTVDYGNRTAITKRYYISDEDYPKAAYYNMLARGHWTIENNLHWMLDVTFKEDASRARKGYAAENLSLVRKLALQIVKQHNDKRSIKKRLFRAALSQDYLKEILLNAKIWCGYPAGNAMFGAISEKFRTFDMQINFAIPPISHFRRWLGEFFFPLSKLRNSYYIINQFIRNIKTFFRHFTTSPK